MKRVVRTTLVPLMVLFGFWAQSTAQDQVSLSKSKHIKFNEESTKTEITLNVGEAYNFMKLSINARSESGSIKVELIDPKGKTKGNFTIEAHSEIIKGDNTEVMEQVTGNMAKKYRNPTIGKWKVIFSPKKAVGQAQVNLTLEYEPKVDLLEISTIEKESSK